MESLIKGRIFILNPLKIGTLELRFPFFLLCIVIKLYLIYVCSKHTWDLTNSKMI